MAGFLICPKGHRYLPQPAGEVDCPYCTATTAEPAVSLDASTIEPTASAAASAPVYSPTVSLAPDQTRGVETLLPDEPKTQSRSRFPRVDGYELLGELGRGGMGVVYKAREISLNRVVALKMILSGDHAEPHLLARFRSEAEAVARLQHPNIVQIYHVGDAQGLPYFSLEFVDGGSLEDQIAAKPQPPRRAAEMVEALARAVAYAHEHGVIHRDLKPANVLLHKEEGGRTETAPRRGPSFIPPPSSFVPKITDFGLAKQVDEKEGGRTIAGTVMGTPNYMAPEQAMGDPVGPSADQYALGAILYEMLTGRPPFMGATPLDTMRQVVAQDPVPPARLQPKLPRDLDTICLKALHKDPRRRYASAEALAGDLRRFLAGEPILARPTTVWERGVKWARRRPAAAALVLVSLVAIFVVVIGGIVYNARLRDARDRAEKNFERAFLAVEQMLTEVAEDQLAYEPGFEEKRRNLLERALRFYEEFLRERADDPKVRFEAARAYRRVGDISRNLGRHERAQEGYRQAIALFSDLAAQTGDYHNHRYHMADAYNWLGESLRIAGRPPDAEKAYTEALLIVQQLMSELQKGSYQFVQGRAQFNLGILYKDTSRPKEAEEAFNLAIATFRRLYDAAPEHPDYRHELARAHLNLGPVLRLGRRYDEAEKTYQRAIELLAGLTDQFPNKFDYRHELGIVHNNLGNVHRLQNRLDDAERSHEQAIALFEKLAIDSPRVPEYRNELANSYNSLGAVLYHARGPEAALEPWQKARERFEKLVLEFPDVTDYKHRLGMTLGNIGWLHLEQKRWKEAVSFLQFARQHESAALQANPANSEYRTLLIQQTNHLLDALLESGRHADAVNVAQTLPKLLGGRGPDYYAGARGLARCVGWIEQRHEPEKERAALSARYVDLALVLLREARKQGHADLAALKGAEFDPLRPHAPFSKFVVELESSAQSAPTESP